LVGSKGVPIITLSELACYALMRNIK